LSLLGALSGESFCFARRRGLCTLQYVAHLNVRS
jgi:hypothetical protein